MKNGKYSMRSCLIVFIFLSGFVNIPLQRSSLGEDSGAKSRLLKILDDKTLFAASLSTGGIRGLKLEDHAGIKTFSKRLDSLFLKSANDDARFEEIDSSAFLAASELLILNCETLSVLLRNSNNLEFGVICTEVSFNQRELEESLVQFRNGMILISHRYKWNLYKDDPSEIGLVLEKSILEVGSHSVSRYRLIDNFSILGSSIFVSFQGKDVIFGNSLETIENLIEKREETSNRLSRSVRTVTNKLNKSALNAGLAYYFNTRNTVKKTNINKYFTFKEILPKLQDDLVDDKLSNEIVGIAGVAEFFNAEARDNSAANPVLLFDNFIVTTVPRKGVLAAADYSDAIEFPDINANTNFVDSVEVLNVNYAKVYNEFMDGYDRLNGEGTWAKKAEENGAKYFLAYDYDAFYEALNGASATIWIRESENGRSTPIRALRFNSASHASRFAEDIANSGFLNSKFPFSASETGVGEIYRRNEKQKKAYGRVLGKPPKDVVYLALKEWFFETNSDVLEALLKQKEEDEDDQNEFEFEYRRLLRFIQNETSNKSASFYLNYRSAHWNTSLLSRLRYNIKLYEERRGLSGVTATTGPRNPTERFGVQFFARCLHSSITKMGRILAVVSKDENSFRITVGFFEPVEFKDFELELGDWSKDIADN